MFIRTRTHTHVFEFSFILAKLVIFNSFNYFIAIPSFEYICVCMCVCVRCRTIPMLCFHLICYCCKIQQFIEMSNYAHTHTETQTLMYFIIYTSLHQNKINQCVYRYFHNNFKRVKLFYTLLPFSL